MVTKAMKQRAGLCLADESIVLTPPLIEQFLHILKSSGRQEQTIRTYRRALEDLYDFLAEEKGITNEILDDWKESLKKSGYSDSTVNTKVVAVNGLLRFCGAEELLASHEKIATDAVSPELTREEYLQFLFKVREIGSEKYYFLIKVLASVDICNGALECLTVEACREGVIYMADEKVAVIPDCLREELLQYAERQGISEGPLFVTREGNPMDRSNIVNHIHRLAIRAGMDPDKCSPSALHRLYLTTQRKLREQLHPLFVQSYESLLNSEQNMVAWK